MSDDIPETDHILINSKDRTVTAWIYADTMEEALRFLRNRIRHGENCGFAHKCTEHDPKLRLFKIHGSLV